MAAAAAAAKLGTVEGEDLDPGFPHQPLVDSLRS